MAKFHKLWRNHPGVSSVCDDTLFPNQCAMRLGSALNKTGITLAGHGLKRCSDAYPERLDDHNPGHIRSAQQLANVFYRKPKLLSPSAETEIYKGSVDNNLKQFRNRKGVLFIKNGWGSTDHIDLWHGGKLKLRGTARSATYRKKGEEVWFWEVKG